MTLLRDKQAIPESIWEASVCQPYSRTKWRNFPGDIVKRKYADWECQALPACPGDPQRDFLALFRTKAFFLPKSNLTFLGPCKACEDHISPSSQHHHPPFYIMAPSSSSHTPLQKVSTVWKATIQVLATLHHITMRELRENNILFLIIWTVKIIEEIF